MSVLMGEKSWELPSRYEAFALDVVGTSSPQSVRLTQKKKCDRSKKKQKVSDVAVAGESPNLKDVSSANASKSLFAPTTGENVRLEVAAGTSKGPAQMDPDDYSTTPSIEGLPQANTNNKQTKPTQSSSKVIREPTVDLLMTESIHGSTGVGEGYGQANVLRLQSSSDSDIFIEDFDEKLPRKVQRQLSLRRTRQWLDSIPDQPSNCLTGDKEHSIGSTQSNNNASPNEDSAQTSILVVSPHPQVREVRIVLQRLDPQMQLKVPIHDIQNLFSQKPYSLTFPQIQKAMENLITSSKIALVPLQNSAKRKKIAMPSGSKEKATGATGESFLRRGRKMKKKRKLLALDRQPSNISEVIDTCTEDMPATQCPYTPLPVKARKGGNKQKPSVRAKKLPIGKPKGASKPKSQPPKTKQNLPAGPEIKSSGKTRASLRKENADGKTRASLRKENADKMARNQCAEIQNEENGSGSTQQPRHEMTLRKSRRTSSLFQPKTQMNGTKQAAKKTTRRRKQFQMVGTFLHRQEMEIVLAAAEKLGGKVDNKVSASTTHVICGGPKRTVNLLRGIARGCWLVRLEWVIKSQEEGHWIDEEPYELTTFSPAVQKCRIARETLGISPTIFKNAGSIYVGPQTAPPKKELTELLKLCGAEMASTIQTASVSVGVRTPRCVSVTELWVLDSIQRSVLLPLQSYLLQPSE